jgi:hypothetical protein
VLQQPTPQLAQQSCNTDATRCNSRATEPKSPRATAQQAPIGVAKLLRPSPRALARIPEHPAKPPFAFASGYGDGDGGSDLIAVGRSRRGILPNDRRASRAATQDHPVFVTGGADRPPRPGYPYSRSRSRLELPNPLHDCSNRTPHTGPGACAGKGIRSRARKAVQGSPSTTGRLSLMARSLAPPVLGT